MERIKKSCSKFDIVEREYSSEEPTTAAQDKLLQDFSSYTTLHGLHFLFDSHSNVRRLIWIALLIGCTAFLVIQFKQSWKKFDSNLSVTSRELEKADSLVFPAVSICNQNMMKKSKIKGKDAQAYLDRMDYWKGFVGRNISSTFDVEKAVRESGHKPEEMMKMCVWRGRQCGPQNFTMFLSFTRGLCYTFNSGKEGHPLLNVTASGKREGLTLSLDAQPEEYYGPFSYEATGFKVLAHDQNEELPNMEDEALDISPGFNTIMRIKRKKMLSLRSPFASACDERNLTHFQTYSQYACLSECYVNITIKKCGCRILSMPGDGTSNQSGFCSMENMFNCVFPIFGEFNPSKCDCPDPCEQVKYKARLSMAYYPSSSLWETIFRVYAAQAGNKTEGRGFTQEDIRKRMAQVTIFYETLVSEVIKERPTYDINDFGSDIGGNMGLFLGCSLLTLCEFIDLIFIGILTCWRRGTRRIATTHVQPR